MTQLILVALGGAIGASLRYLSGLAITRFIGIGFPWGTLFVNVLGSFAMGLLIAWLARRTGGASTDLRLLLATGVLGGFTTFSAFSLDFATLWQRGDTTSAAIYVIMSVGLSLMAIFMGLWFARAIG